MEDMQINHKLHITRIIYACRIWKQNRTVTSTWKKINKQAKIGIDFWGLKSKKKWKKDGQTKQQTKMECVQNEK